MKFDAINKIELQRDDLYIEATAENYLSQKLEGFKPNPDLPSFKIELPLDWGMDPFLDANWVLTLQSWRMSNSTIAHWYKTKDPVLLKEVLDYAIDWWRFHCTGGTTTHSWDDIAVGIRSFKIAFLAERWNSGDIQLDPREEREFMGLADAHIDFLNDPKNLRENNHGLFVSMGLRHLAAKLPRCEKYEQAYLNSNSYMKRVMDSQFTAEGIHRENSPGYHVWVARILRELNAAKWFNNKSIREVIIKAEENSPWLVFPDKTVARIGDTWNSGIPLKNTDNPHILSNGDKYAVGDFHKSGWVIVRSDPTLNPRSQSMLFVTAMCHNHTHKHADDLAFELFINGEKLFIDSGQYSFGIRNPEARAMRKYLESAAAHNTIDTLAGLHKQDTLPYGSGISSLRLQDDIFNISGLIKNRGQRFQHKRDFRYAPGRFLHINDHLSSETEEFYVNRLHIDHNVEVHVEKNIAIARTDKFTARISSTGHNKEILAIRGKKSPLLGWRSVLRRGLQEITTLENAQQGHSVTCGWKIEFDTR